ncbi:MAG: hypothetical protein KME26_00880 [Oscillatoria princeps RMCB-10]|nr:hypothetical protein [Oscillatoria princeps RMCB-10]
MAISGCLLAAAVKLLRCGESGGFGGFGRKIFIPHAAGMPVMVWEGLPVRAARLARRKRVWRLLSPIGPVLLFFDGRT